MTLGWLCLSWWLTPVMKKVSCWILASCQPCRVTLGTAVMEKLITCHCSSLMNIKGMWPLRVFPPTPHPPPSGWDPKKAMGALHLVSSLWLSVSLWLFSGSDSTPSPCLVSDCYLYSTDGTPSPCLVSINFSTDGTPPSCLISVAFAQSGTSGIPSRFLIINISFMINVTGCAPSPCLSFWLMSVPH